MKITCKIDKSIHADFCINSCYEPFRRLFTQEESAGENTLCTNDVPGTSRVAFADHTARHVILCKDRAVSKSEYASHLKSFLQKAGEYSHIQQVREFAKAKGGSRSTKGGTGIRSNVVNISQKAADEMGILPNQIALIAGSTTLNIVECTICPVPDQYNADPELSEQEILLSFYLRNFFKDDRSVFILQPPLIRCASVRVQASQNIKDRNLSVDPQLYSELESLHPELIELRHLATGATMTVPLSQIIPDSSLNPEEQAIKLTYFQRKILNVNKGGISSGKIINPLIKDKIRRVNFDTSLYIKDSVSNNSAVVARIIYDGSASRLFCSVPAVIPDPGMEILNENDERFDIISVNIDNRKPDDSPAELEILVNQHFTGSVIRFCNEKINPNYYGLQLFPLYTGHCGKDSPRKRITNWFVGKSELNLSAVRPYSVDDDRDIIRLSPDNMALLGIEETDRVIIRHNNKEVMAAVLAIDSLELMQETNIIANGADLDIIVGIPNPLRRELDIHDVETEVTVERDTWFLFKKNANIQFLPIVAFLFTIMQIWPPKDYGGFRYWVIIISSFLIGAVLIMFLMLSPAREKVKGSKRKNSRKRK